MEEHSLFDESPSRTTPTKNGTVPEPNTCRVCGESKHYDGNLTILNQVVCALCRMKGHDKA